MSAIGQLVLEQQADEAADYYIDVDLESAESFEPLDFSGDEYLFDPAFHSIDELEDMEL